MLQRDICAGAFPIGAMRAAQEPYMTRSLMQPKFVATQARRAILAVGAILAVAMLAAPMSASAQAGSRPAQYFD